MSDTTYYLLQSDWVLRGYRDDINLAYNIRDGRKFFLSGEELATAMLLDGQTDFSSPTLPPVFRRILKKFLLDGIAVSCLPGNHLHAQQAYHQAKNSYIESLLLSVTNKCNFRCRHCFVDAPKHMQTEFSQAQLFNLIDQFAQASVTDIALTGGEPFIRPELPRFLERLRARYIGFSEVFTNAALLNDELLDMLDALDYHPYFKVSFDCVGSHDYMRGVAGAEEATLRGVRLLKQRGYSVTIITSIDKIVARGMLETLELLYSLEVDNWWMAPPMEVGAWRGSDSAVSVEELMPLLKKVLLRWDKLGRPFDMIMWRMGHIHSRGRIMQKVRNIYNADSLDCKPMHAIPYVTPDGTLVPCGSYTGTELAQEFPNLMHTRLTDAWDDPALRKLCDLSKGAVREVNPGCRTCQFFTRCGCGCRASALLSRGDHMLNDPVTCKLYRGGYMDDFYAFACALDGEVD